MMLAVQPRRLLSRPKNLFVFALLAAVLYWTLLHRSSSGYHIVGSQSGLSEHPAPPLQVAPSLKDGHSEQTPLEEDKLPGKPAGKNPPIDTSKGGSNSGKSSQEYAGPSDSTGDDEDMVYTDEERLQEAHERKEKALRTQFEKESEDLAKQPDAGALYGNTLATLVNKTSPRKLRYEAALKPGKETTGFSPDKPQVYDPYPHYNGKEWKATKKASYVACDGPDGVQTEDIMVFKGTPHGFPQPGFGGYDVLDIDGNLCFERETRLSPYGYSQKGGYDKKPSDWSKVKWGQLQEMCARKNKARFNLQGPQNPYVDGLYSRANSTASTIATDDDSGSKAIYASEEKSTNDDMSRGGKSQQPAKSRKPVSRRRGLFAGQSKQSEDIVKEERTALLIRTYTGKEYSENDKQIIRSLVTELALRTGGQYQVFLFVQVKDTSINIWENDETYEWTLHRSVPPEFVDMTVLWNDDATLSTYPKLGYKQASVHVAQWLSVQKFAQEFSEFDYVWNWELDSRVTSHHYEFLEKLVSFAKKQPRRGLWERNERYYIPSVHGDYDTDFRKEVERRAVNGSVWGPPELPFINPIGPKPPVKNPEDDDYKWGVGEQADLITVAPIFNPVNSSWIGADDVWGYNDSSHSSLSLPRRTTIITQSRVSRRLLNIMHVENLRGNHISSEMTTQTVALLHGLKAVYAPMPIFFDRAWSGQGLAKWFNGGWDGESGGIGSAMGWGREGRFSGSTWYFRANPPQRLYMNWMGWEDTSIGGPEWEEVHGRPCLPPMLLHPIKDVVEMEPGHSSESKLPYA